MGRRRQIIEVPGVDHGAQPFPLAVRVDNLLLSSGIHGMDPEAHSVPEEPAQQVAFMFQNIRAVMDQAGCSTDDIVQIIVMLSDRRFRDLVNEQWVAMFPDPNDRPARNTQVQDLAGAMVCSALVTAVIPSDL